MSVLALGAGLLPPTLNLDTPGPGCELDHVSGVARRAPVRAALSNSFAFGGHNVSLVFGPPSTRLARGAAAEAPAPPLP